MHSEAALHEYVPALHVLQEMAPDVLANEPASQWLHELPWPEFDQWPGKHWLQPESAVVEYVPALHSLHELDAGLAAYVPALHALHESACPSPE